MRSLVRQPMLSILLGLRLLLLQSSESPTPRGLTATSRPPSCSSRCSEVVGSLESRSSEPTCSCREWREAGSLAEEVAARCWCSCRCCRLLMHRERLPLAMMSSTGSLLEEETKSSKTLCLVVAAAMATAMAMVKAMAEEEEAEEAA